MLTDRGLRHCGPPCRSPFSSFCSTSSRQLVPLTVSATTNTHTHRRCLESLRATAVSKSDLDELEMQIAVVNQEMNSAATEERFREAAEFRDRLERLRLRQRCLQIEHNEVLRSTICHHLGQIVHHRRYKYRGVIFGVHSSCQASDTWIQTMGVDKLPNGRHQPFYQVLVDERDRPGGMITYVAQENIENLDSVSEQRSDVGSEAPIIHVQIAQMFEGYDETSKRYQPSAKLVSMYPDSLEARSSDKSTEIDTSEL